VNLQPDHLLARMNRMYVSVLVCVMAPAVAAADHQHGMVAGASEQESTFAAGLSLVAAEFDTMEYGGDYQGLVPSVRWVGGRFAASANIGVYQLKKNGLEMVGAGDAMVHGQARLLGDDRVGVGVALAVLAPIGDHQAGLGMGHPMVMPAVSGRWSDGQVAFDGSLGYGKAFGGAQSHHSHGAWPLVDPMNLQELTFTASGDLSLARALRVGGRVSGGAPIGDGATRVIGGVRVLWTEGRVDTAFEIQAGLAGDPFRLRGVLETAVRF
jgi:hypothetical protein